AVHLYQLLRGVDAEPAASVATGDLDPLLRQSHFQVAMASRSRHRSQDMGRALTPGPQTTQPVRVATRLDGIGSGASGDAAGASLFVGVDTTFFAHALKLNEGLPTGIRELLTRYEATIDDSRRVF